MGIRLRDVSYRYPTASAGSDGNSRLGWALLHIDLEIADGELLVVLGRNGAGKSTLCLTLNGLVPRFYKGRLEGEVVVNGRSTATAVTDLVASHTSSAGWDARARRRAGVQQNSCGGPLVTQIGVVFQNPFDQLTGAAGTVFEEVAIGPENLGLPRDEARQRVQQALADAGIAELAERHPLQLSGGQQQRVAIASVLAMRPRILVLDEPTSQLDPVGTIEVLDVVRRLHEQGMTVVLAEHKVDAIAALADRVAVLKDGRLARIGEPRRILTDPEIEALGILPPRPTILAQELARLGIWRGSLPLTVEEAEAGLMEVWR